jgi:hypothetical protein
MSVHREMLLDFLLEVEDRLTHRLDCADPGSAEYLQVRAFLVSVRARQSDLSQRYPFRWSWVHLLPAEFCRQEGWAQEYNLLAESTRPEGCTSPRGWYIAQ